MAYDSNLHPYHSFDWDLHRFGVFNADMSLVMESPFSSDLSTGYLQDAIGEWTDRCKRRRMSSFPDNGTTEDSGNLVQDSWNSSCYEDTFAKFNSLSHHNYLISDDGLNSSNNSISMDTTLSTGMGTRESAVPVHEQLSSSSSSYKESATRDPDEKDTSESRDPVFLERRPRRKKLATGVVYPFTVVKPGGIEGDVTLDDINARILMRPMKPVRHPVGEFACLPCVSANGPGLSGKAVVALTRIHTQGRGTVTIIRTRG